MLAAMNPFKRFADWVRQEPQTEEDLEEALEAQRLHEEQNIVKMGQQSRSGATYESERGIRYD
jgi:hypothetical protein